MDQENLERAETVGNTNYDSQANNERYGEPTNEAEAPMGLAESPTPNREVNIKPLSSGYVVTVGCQTVAVEKTETLLKHLTRYLNNPSDYEKKWFGTENRNRLDNID